MKGFVTFLLLVTTASALGSYPLLDKRLDAEWDSFKRTYGKRYLATSEEIRRRFIWQRNRQSINEHNARADLGLHSYRMAINNFADMTTHEALSKFDRLNDGSSRTVSKTHLAYPENLPEVVDWNEEGYVTPVRDQGESGSPVGIAVTGSIEGVLAIRNRKLIPLAYQEIEDCYKGGTIPGAFESLIKIGGIMSEAAYSNSTNNGTCHFDPKKSECRLEAYRKVEGSELALQASVAKVGPIVIAINADKFLFYVDGIFDDSSCAINGPNHALLVTGYGSEGREEYWSAKNSWGSWWGEQGYIRIKRNANICDIADNAYFPVLA